MKNQYCTLYVVRHGETDWNKKGIIQGYSDVDLNEMGKRQARKLANQLKQINFDAIFSSDLLRAKKTAEVISSERKLVIKTVQVLRERNWGRLEGIFSKNLNELDKLFNNLEEKQKFRYKYYPEVESDEELSTRLITFIREIAIAYKGKTILAVTHGGIIRALLLRLNFLKYKNSLHNTIPNTAYVKLVSDGVDFYIQEAKGIKKNP